MIGVTLDTGKHALNSSCFITTPTTCLEDMNTPGWHLHALTGSREDPPERKKNFFSVLSVSSVVKNKMDKGAQTAPFLGRSVFQYLIAI